MDTNNRPVLAEYQAQQGLVMDRYTAKNHRRRARRHRTVGTFTADYRRVGRIAKVAAASKRPEHRDT